jgi:two-component system chemotaxis response regulator CheY
MAFNILIVDDSEVMRSVISRVVKLSGFDVGAVYEADNGENALKILDTNWVDIVLSDINMPVMDGVELLKRIKESDMFSDVPVVIISTEGRSNRIEDIMEIGASGYITKPFKPEEIRDILCESLGVDVDGTLADEPEDSDF